MTKATVNRLYLSGLVAVIAGAVVGFASVWIAFANNVFVMDGPDVIGIDFTPFAATVLTVAAIACLAMIGGGLAMFIAWIGALLNTAQLDSKIWFVVLLVVGLTCLGFIPMLAYVIGGPDGTEHAPRFAAQPA